MAEESLLKRKRIEKGLSLEDVEKILKIRKRHLYALEEENYTDTPGITYAIGYVRAYSTLLDLTEEEKKEIIDKINKAFNKKEKEQPVFIREVIKLEDEEKKEKEEKPKQRPSFNFKKLVVLGSIVIVIGILGFFGFRLLSQGEEFSFNKKGVFTPIAKVTVKTNKKLVKENKANTTPTPVFSGTPLVTVTAEITPTPPPRFMAKFSIKVVPKKQAWAKVSSNNNVLFEGIMLKGKEYIFKSTEPITIVMEKGEDFNIYVKDENIEVPKGDFVKYSLSKAEEPSENNG